MSVYVGRENQVVFVVMGERGLALINTLYVYNMCVYVRGWETKDCTH